MSFYCENDLKLWITGLRKKKIKLWYQQITLLSTRISEYSVNVSMEVRAVEQYNFIHISVQFSRSVESDSLRPHEPQHARPPGPSTTPRVYPNPCPLSRWCHQTISSSVVPVSPALNLSQNWGLFQWVNSSHQVAKVLEFQLQHQSFQWTPRTDL